MTAPSEERAAVVEIRELIRKHLDLACGHSLMGRQYHTGYFNGLTRALDIVQRGEHRKDEGHE